MSAEQITDKFLHNAGFSESGKTNVPEQALDALGCWTRADDVDGILEAIESVRTGSRASTPIHPKTQNI